jgi:prepilin-type N-terminal cleavage/methylation domain-containing protein
MMFRDVKKGFTFVELAIVLVIIGIIMGMAIKGRQLIESAKTRSEVRKLEKIQSSVAGWLSNTGSDSTPTEFKRLSPSYAGGDSAVSTNAKLSSATWLDLAQLPEVTSSIRSNSFGDNWSMIGGEWKANSAEVAGGSSFILVSRVSPRFGCNAENMLDDKFFYKGELRSDMNEYRLSHTTSAGAAPTTDDNETAANPFRTCDEWVNVVDNVSFVGYRLGL